MVLNCAVQFKDGIDKPFVVNWLKYPNKLPIYIWYAGYPAHIASGYEGRVSRIGLASLNLTRVQLSDQGIYECQLHFVNRRAENSSSPQSNSESNWIALDVQGKLSFYELACVFVSI